MPLSQSGHLPRGQRHCSQLRGSASSEESSQLHSDLIPYGRGTQGRPGQRGKPVISSSPVPSTEILSSARPLRRRLWPTVWPGLSDVIVLISSVRPAVLGVRSKPLFWEPFSLVFCLTSRLSHFIPTVYPLSFSLFEAAGSFIQWLKYLITPSRRAERHRKPPLKISPYQKSRVPRARDSIVLFRRLRPTPSPAPETIPAGSQVTGGVLPASETGC